MTFELYRKSNYGTIYLYPKNPDQAAAFLDLTGQKTVTMRQIAGLRALGFEVRETSTPEQDQNKI